MKSMKLSFLNLLLIAAVAGFATAANAATPLAPASTAVVIPFSWDNPTKRTNGDALPAADIAKINLYLTPLSAAIVILPVNGVVPNTYDYTLPAGTCFKTTDAAAVTASDKAGLQSTMSNYWSPAVDLCPKSPPAAPAGLKMLTGAPGQNP